MKLASSALILLGWGAVLLFNGERVRDAMDEGAQVRQERAKFNQVIKRNETQLFEAQRLSEIALERARTGCILTLDTETQNESYLKPGQVVRDRHDGDVLANETLICNALGDTAIIRNGKVEDLARISPEDYNEFKQILGGRK